MKKIQILAIFFFIMFSSCHNTSFDSEKWKRWEESESNMRMRLDMVNDLISNYDLTGKSFSEIEELLGKPSNDCNYENCQMSYNLGPCRGFGISYGVLKVQLKDWKAIEVSKNCH